MALLLPVRTSPYRLGGAMEGLHPQRHLSQATDEGSRPNRLLPGRGRKERLLSSERLRELEILQAADPLVVDEPDALLQRTDRPIEH